MGKRVEIPVVRAGSKQCGIARCGSEPSADLPEEIRKKVFDHPCYAEEAHHRFARMHLPVAPACNIQCHYCNRKYDCSNESRPGVVSEVLQPEEAVAKVQAVVAAIPQLRVVGIAGPGDALANPKRTFSTFRLLRRHFPDLRLCLSTNGLMLPEWASEIVALGVEHVTITINAVDPAVAERIYSWVFWKHKRLRGREAAAVLLERQMEGLERLTERGVLVKVNSVLIPGINDDHLPEVARRVRSLGAFLLNIMPLISAPEFGTYFGLTGQRGPTEEELRRVQQACEGEMMLMRHCHQCRADAIGLLGEDRHEEFSVQALVASARRNGGQKRVAEGDRRRVARVAVASRDGRLVDEHFGHATALRIYDVDEEEVREVEVRPIGHRYCSGEISCGEGEEVLAAVLAAIYDCDALLCARIGIAPWEAIEAAGIVPSGEYAFVAIDEALRAIYTELKTSRRLRRGAESARAA
ncbi:MAG: nitrogenase cofactor biosynthesis protein NifB [Hydrogenophilus sp.]|nr:nitrogenase cofactor biosynthesis protein NifB [Hydrogenophilus sp.]